MATVLDTKIVSKIKAVLDKYGTDARFQGNATYTYNHATGENEAAGAAIDTTVKAAPPYEYSSFEVDDKNILRQDLKTIIRGDFAPEQGQTCTIAGTMFKIIHVEPVYSGDDVAAYMLQLRK